MKLFLRKKFISIFVPVFIVLSTLIFSAGYFLYVKEMERLKNKTKQHYYHLLNQQNELLLANFTPAITDISFLSKQRSVINFINNPNKIDDLKFDLQTFTESNSNFKQVRLLDVNGMEKMRFNWLDDSIVFVPDSLLQDKSHRFYFSESIKLKTGEIYISPVDLNIENKKVEIPFQRVIRFATPIHNRNGELKGILIINQYLNNLFTRLKSYNNADQGDFMLLDSEGYWLLPYKNKKAFGFMFDSLKTEKLSKYYPETWEKMVQMGKGETYTDEGFFIFSQFTFNNNTFQKNFLAENIISDDSNKWHLAVRIATKEVEYLKNIPQLFIFLALFSFVIIFIISYVISRLRYKEIIYLQNLTQLNETLEDKIKERTAQLADKNQELEKLNQELESFSYSVSHDLRAPLRYITSFIDLIFAKTQELQLTKQVTEYLKNIKTSANDMKQLIEDILNLSRLGTAKLNTKPFNMNELVDKVVIQVIEQYQKQEIKWHIDTLPTVYGDPMLLKQVWFNLLSNAVKYSSKKEYSTVEIKSKEENNAFIFSVKDNGVGFDMEESNKLFVSFERLSQSKGFEGTGIGLSIVHKIITKHEGKVWAESKKNNGACFYFSLPKKSINIKQNRNKKINSQFIYS